MLRLEVINHTATDIHILQRAASIKQKAWPYPMESQLEWIKKNLSINDLHLFLLDEGEDVAYMNLVDISLEVDGINYKGYGIGNVCAAVKGMGYGGKLLSLTNDYLKRQRRVGLLFCMSHVERFYAHYGWKKVNRSKTDIQGLSTEVLVYSFGLPDVNESLIYTGKLF